ncbi:MAG: MogA/MoaB family molybdenum cofactor biosynthesis protein [Phycisphaerales bacterium]|nr:MAG: MogA/MoaB family molybdenum cofactor biosynthesis protein [Phycisphaerales bacterium]
MKPDNDVKHESRPLRFRIITVSDRASRGEYEDRGGPRARQLVEEFMQGKHRSVEIESMVLPDDPALLRKELQRVREVPCDVIITTGGTGVGPRDMTPDVVAGECDKLIPGITEYIRVKYGADNPTALLSRSVAGILGSTLIYTLPGSVKAVEEYMSEILKSLEHLLLMVHGVDAH